MKSALKYGLVTGLVLLSSAAIADLSILDGTGATKTLVNFVCQTTKLCQAYVPINSSGTEIATSANPIRVDPTGTTTQPVSVTGVSTATNQASQITQETAINTVLGTQADTVCGTATGTCTLQALIKYLNAQAAGAIPAGTNTIGNVGPLQYPIGATPITASATGTTAATTATLAGAASKTTYICGYSIRANATANTNVTNTLTGVISGTMSSIMWVPANTAGLGVDEQLFQPCIPASATNTAIATVSGAPGTGGLVSVKAWGFQL